MLLIFFLSFFFSINLCKHNINKTYSNIYFKINHKDNIHNQINSSRVNIKKNVILGTLMNYSLDQVLPFFNSLIQANFSNCDVVIFIRDVNIDIIRYLKRIGVILKYIPREYNNTDITKLRWKLYNDFLNNRKSQYNLVFTTDIRDVFFQKDIFQNYKGNKSFLGFALEDETLNETTNKMWITTFAGEEKHKAIQNKTIICFGTIWGTIDKIIEFSEILWNKVKFDKNSTDQGIGNYLIYYEKLFNDCLIISSNYGPVITIGWNKRENITLDSNDNILNFRNEIASVIHQYDRHPDILMKIQKKFSYKFKEGEINLRSDDYYKNIINILLFSILIIIFFLMKKLPKLCRNKNNKILKKFFF